MSTRDVNKEGPQYAYSVFDIRNVKEAGANQKRTFTGIASAISVDRMDDIVIPRGAKFKLPFPLLWQHSRKEPIGWVRAARVSDKSIEVDCEVHDEKDPGRLKDRLDDCWQQMRAGLVGGLSIGFNPLKWSYIEGSYGVEYQEFEILELSPVTIAAHPDAAITAIKAIQTAARKQRGATKSEGFVESDAGLLVPSPTAFDTSLAGRAWPHAKKCMTPW